MIAIILRIMMSTIGAYIYRLSMQREDTEAQVRLIALKIQTFEFSIPLYCFLMISVTLDFSAISFYLNLRDLLYPKIKEEDLANQKWH